MRQYFSNTAFIDLLFNIVIGIAFLFIVAFLLINPISKKNDIKSKADYIVMLYWEPESVHDIDIWMTDPAGNVLSFKNKTVGLMHLDRDDLGYKNDKITYPDGTVITVKSNEETAVLRGTLEGWYTVNVHAYRKQPKFNNQLDKWVNDELPVRVTLIQVNPYNELLRKEFIMIEQGTEITAFRFELDKNGEMISFDEKYVPMVTIKYGEVSVREGTGGF